MSARHARLDMQDRREEHGGRGKRAAFRGWRRSRPFWGGVLLVIAGLELLAIPLSGVLIKGQVKLVIYIGIGGVFGVLIGALLIVAGIVLWVNPAHRVFYGIAGIVLGILSFPASNLGGFFLGMLLAILGGALAFAWTPAPPAPPAPLRFSSDPRMNPAQRMLALAAMPAMLVVGLTGAARQGQSGNCILLGLICQPGSSASPSASASPSTSPSPGSGSPGLLPSLPLPSGAASPSPSASPNDPSGKNSKKATVKHASAPSGLTASNATSVLTASSATLHKMKLVGIVTLPVGGGSGSEQALELTASSASMSGVDIDVTQGGATTSTKSPTLAFGGGLTLYTTKMCGQVEGITPTVCFTPSTASKVVLKLASVLGKAEPITMTSVTVDQMLASGASMRTGALTMGL
jgi:uncharacterized protein DUF6114